MKKRVSPGELNILRVLMASGLNALTYGEIRKRGGLPYTQRGLRIKVQRLMKMGLAESYRISNRGYYLITDAGRNFWMNEVERLEEIEEGACSSVG